MVKAIGNAGMVAINPQAIEGNWRSGVALDFHTIRSTPVGQNEYGHMQFETERPPVAELLYQLKYKNDQAAAPELIATAAEFLRPHRAKLDVLIPVPASTVRAVQPVILLARGIGAELGLPVAECIATTRSMPHLKNVTDPEERRELLKGLYAVDACHTEGKNILLFDDLFRSGSTMSAITDVLLRQGRAASVRVLTITRTRSNR